MFHDKELRGFTKRSITAIVVNTFAAVRVLPNNTYVPVVKMMFVINIFGVWN